METEPTPEPIKKRRYSKGLSTNLGDQSETIKRVVATLIENPRARDKELAELAGVSFLTIKKAFQSNAYVKVLRQLATGRMKALIPYALKGLKECLESTNDRVKLDASIALLKSERIMGTDKIDVTVTEGRKSIEEMREIVRRAKLIPSPMVEEALVIGHNGNGNNGHS